MADNKQFPAGTVYGLVAAHERHNPELPEARANLVRSYMLPDGFRDNLAQYTEQLVTVAAAVREGLRMGHVEPLEASKRQLLLSRNIGGVIAWEQTKRFPLLEDEYRTHTRSHQRHSGRLIGGPLDMARKKRRPMEINELLRKTQPTEEQHEHLKHIVTHARGRDFKIVARAIIQAVVPERVMAEATLLRVLIGDRQKYERQHRWLAKIW